MFCSLPRLWDATLKLDIPEIVACHLCTRLRNDGIKAMSRGFSGGKQVLKSPNTKTRC